MIKSSFKNYSEGRRKKKPINYKDMNVVRDVEYGSYIDAFQRANPTTGRALSTLASFGKNVIDLGDSIFDVFEAAAEVQAGGGGPQGITTYIAKRVAARSRGISIEEYDETNPYNVVELKKLSSVLDKAVIKYKDKETGKILDSTELFSAGEYDKAASTFVNEVAGAAPSLVVSRLPGGYALLGGSTFIEKLNKDLVERDDQDVEKVMLNAIIYGGSDAIGEYFGGRFLNNLGKVVGVGGKVIPKNMKDVAIKSIGNMIKMGFKGGSSEAMQEAITAAIQSYGDEFVYGDEVTQAQRFRRILHAGLIGFGLGSGSGAMSSRLNGSVQQRKQMAEYFAPGSYKKQQVDLSQELETLQTDAENADADKKEFFNKKVEKVKKKKKDLQDQMYERFINYSDTETEYFLDLEQQRHEALDIINGGRKYSDEAKKEAKESFMNATNSLEELFAVTDINYNKDVEFQLSNFVRAANEIDETNNNLWFKAKDLEYTYVDSKKELDELKKQYGKDVGNSADGFFDVTIDGKKKIFINRDVAAAASATNVIGHELLHYAISNRFANNPKVLRSSVVAFNKYLDEVDPNIRKSIEKRLANPKNEYAKFDENGQVLRDEDGLIVMKKEAYIEEYFTMFSDLAKNKKIKVVEEASDGIKNNFRAMVRGLGLGFNNVDFQSGQEVFNLLLDYNKNIGRTGLLGRITQKKAVESVGGKKKQKVKTGKLESRSKAVDSVNETENKLREKLKEKGKDYTKEEFQKSQEFNSIFSSINLNGGAINSYIKSLGMSAAKTKEVIENAAKRLLNYNPQAERKAKDGKEITIGEAIMSNIGFAKKDAAKKLFQEGQKKKRTKSIDELDQDIEDVAITTQQTDVKDAKLRKLKDFNVELDNGLADALTIAEVEDILDNFNNGKITFEQAQKEIDKIVLKDIRASLSKAIPGISKGKPTPEYEAFIRNEYDEIIQSLGIKTIRTSYKKFFTQEKTGKKDYKNIDPVTGKVSNFVKDTQVNTTNKREFIKYFLEGKSGVLTERRTALIRRIAKRKASLAVDNYIETNSGNIEAVVKARIRTFSDSAENATNEQVSFDHVRFSKSVESNNLRINKQMEKYGQYKAPDGSIMTFYKKANGTWNKGFVNEQATNETMQEVVKDFPGWQVDSEVAKETGGYADIVFRSPEGVVENHEIKQDFTARMSSVKISKINIETAEYTLANPAHNDIPGLDAFMKDAIKEVKNKVKQINQYNKEYNEKYNYKKGDSNYAEEVTGKSFPRFFIPAEVDDRMSGRLIDPNTGKKGLGKTLVKRVISGREVVANAYANKKIIVDGKKIEAPVLSMTIGGVGSYRLGENSIFKGLPLLDIDVEVRASLRNSTSKKINGVKYRDKYIGIEFYISGKVKNKPNSGIITKQGFKESVNNNALFSKNISGVKNISDAVRMSRSANDPKGITVLDFDDTLATSKSLIRYTDVDGTKGTLTPEQYASTYQDLLGLGYKFDFSEFNKVVDGKVAPLFQKALKLQGKFGPENMFVLTARPAESAPAIFAFLKANGLNIPLKNITGLANSTSEAKALWIAGKVGEGFNDFYFADDALQNVQAVKNMLDQFDVKSKVQQAKVKFSKSLGDDFNNILENVTGIESFKRFERTKARKRGASKGKFRLFIPPSHEDFVGLLYNFMGKGKEGDAHRDFFEKALIRPLNRAYKEVDTAKQAVANDYKALNKQMPEVNKMLSKKTPDGDFTYQDAIRVYLWDKHGYKIPGLSDIDQASLVELVKSDGMLQSYADTLNVISKQETYVDPGPNWENGNIRIDLVDATGRVGRAQFFEEFQENADIIFSEENLNKIEAGYGSNLREALEDMLHRIKTGVNRPKGSSAKPNIYMNWLNASVAGVMFFNVRSSLLQQMSNVNYLNFADNNILAAGKAFANQLQYWKDFAMIFNSDMLKQRRGGLQTDINGAELAEAIKKARPGNMFDQVAIIVGKALRLGFLPTQIGDNIAIATGGAAFYRNRVNKYLKDGLSKKEAEAKAFTDFQDITQSTQQSARPDMTSKQQASWIGKLILNFLNTPSQYNRIIKKAASDLKNRRITPPNTSLMQSNMSNMSRILYYGAAQNLIFYSLQTALFAVMFGNPDDEDEEKRVEQFLKKKERVINGSIDTILRGSGIYGVALSTLKNMAIKFLEQREKGYNKDESAVVMELFNFSPVVGIKARRIVNAEKTLNYNKKVIEEMETFDIDNPMWSAVTNYTQTITTAPVNKIYQKTINLRNAADRDYTALQRLLFFSGYTTWSLNLGDTKKMKKIKEDIKNRDKKPRDRKLKKRRIIKR